MACPSVPRARSPREALVAVCIRQMEALRLDWTQLLALRHWEWLDLSEWGQKLKRFAEGTLGLCREDAASAEFHWAVYKAFERGEGRITGVAPERRVEAYRKEELFQLYRQAQWPEPHTPYLVQMRPGVFILFSSWRDGFLVVQGMTASGMYRTKDGRMLDVSLVYEGQIEGVPSRIILDCEAYVREFGGKMTRAELDASVRRVPQTLARRLAQMGAIKDKDMLRFYVKNKSRGDKVSFHFVSNILVEPTVDGRNVLRQVFVDKFREARDIAKKTKSMAHAVKDGKFAAELHVDAKTLHGRHQFSCVFSRKPGEEPCVIESRLDISEGGTRVVEHPSALAGEAHVPESPHAMQLLYFGGLAHFIGGMVTLNPRFRVGGQAKNMEEAQPSPAHPLLFASLSSRTGARFGGRGGGSSLPEWMKSAMRPGQHYAENRQMGSLRDRLATLRKYLTAAALSQRGGEAGGEVGLEDMAHVIGGCFCPVLTLYGAPRFHSSNGVYVAIRKDGRAVYASCSNCEYTSEMGGKKGLVEIVPGLEKSAHPWVVYTEENYANIVKASKSSGDRQASSQEAQDSNNKRQKV